MHTVKLCIIAVNNISTYFSLLPELFRLKVSFVCWIINYKRNLARKLYIFRFNNLGESGGMSTLQIENLKLSLTANNVYLTVVLLYHQEHFDTANIPV